MHPVPETSYDEVLVRPVEVDWSAETEESGSSPVDMLNNAVKDYWGLIVFGGLVLTAGIFIGRRVL